MNKDNAKEFLPLVQALADGKTIQENNYRVVPPAKYEWTDMKEVHFSREVDCYRVKPDPMEFECWIASVQKDILVTDSDMSAHGSGWKKIRVREIL